MHISFANRDIEELDLTSASSDTSQLSLVTSLDLSHNCLVQLSDLRLFSGLTHLDLSHNPHLDVSTLREVLPTSLTSIDLTGVVQTMADLRVLASVLPVSVTSLQLRRPELKAQVRNMFPQLMLYDGEQISFKPKNRRVSIGETSSYSPNASISREEKLEKELDSSRALATRLVNKNTQLSAQLNQTKSELKSLQSRYQQLQGSSTSMKQSLQLERQRANASDAAQAQIRVQFNQERQKHRIELEAFKKKNKQMHDDIKSLIHYILSSDDQNVPLEVIGRYSGAQVQEARSQQPSRSATPNRSSVELSTLSGWSAASSAATDFSTGSNSRRHSFGGVQRPASAGSSSATSPAARWQQTLCEPKHVKKPGAFDITPQRTVQHQQQAATATPAVAEDPLQIIASPEAKQAARTLLQELTAFDILKLIEKENDDMIQHLRGKTPDAFASRILSDVRDLSWSQESNSSSGKHHHHQLDIAAAVSALSSKDLNASEFLREIENSVVVGNDEDTVDKKAREQRVRELFRERLSQERQKHQLILNLQQPQRSSRLKEQGGVSRSVEF